MFTPKLKYMKIIKVIFVILAISFLAKETQAQFSMPNYKDVLEMKNRQPIVIVNPPNPDIINKFSRKGNDSVMQEYQQIIGNYNENMKSAVKKFWTFNSKEVLFKTRTELSDILQDKSQRNKYIIIYCYSFDTRPKRDMDWTINKSGERITGTRTYFAIGFPDEMPIYQQALKDLIPSPTILAYYVSVTNYNFNYILNHKDNYKMKDMIEKNAHILSQKTLLILSSSVSPKVMKDINTYYPCNFKLVNEDEMEKAVTSGDPSYAYVIKTGIGVQTMVGGQNDMNFIVNCEDGATLGYTSYGTIPVPFSTDQGLRKDFFQDIAYFCNAGKKK